MKTLSKNNAELRIILPLILGLLGSIIAFVILAAFGILKLLLSLGLLILGIFWTYHRYIHSYNIFYDEEQLILKNKKEQRNIALTNIKRVKLTLSDMRLMGFQFYEYKIDFTNETGSSETINFFISNSNSLLWEFQDLIKLKSPNTKIENYARSWEK
ncbi:hypothetical protein FPF71_17795 [Algibacter amylolyticus]|uniref:Uncharacterized protein n=1 Tax=Algibacter amylolyticus TaxID=1608400 RepID=A0A5M7AZQ9_9FLAO|nr:hypothetical protein [Algibacter amylolyticus]KAA5820401.1 hypothetical protein F2B50_17795 [Algibacter amylolyticus]MBB5270002.1 putative membrane protein [Algibacter amylolyticus]TSJ70450.1 hypothetical protein FPF71_17795 [Algibacter amylolyticus]